MGWGGGGSCRGGVVMQGWVSHIVVGWGRSCSGGVGWVMQGWGGVGHAGVGWCGVGVVCHNRATWL